MSEFAKKQLRPTVGNLLRQVRIHPPGDRYETEADRMAQNALSMPGAMTHRGPGNGSTLPDSVRTYFEPRFGHDFSRVRVHTNDRASRSAKVLGASAYTSGRDIVFGAGQFAPETMEGRQLIAHELAHVVQQDRGRVAPGIQRRLMITGSARDADDAVHLLEPASGLTLKRNPKTGEVSITASVRTPPSVVLAAELMTIIDDPAQDAEIHTGHKDPPKMSAGVLFGAFPDNDTPLVQEVRMDQILALEKGAPGAGVYTLFHEISENFAAHETKELEFDKETDRGSRDMLHSFVHPIAEEKANLVAGEILGKGGERRAFFEVPMGKKPKQFLRGVEDMGQYFLVWDRTMDGKSTVSNTRKADRIRVSSYTIPGFSADSQDVPAAAAGVIASIADDMKKNPAASALFEGFASAAKTSKENERLASKWISLTEEAVFDKAQDDVVVSHFRFIEEGHSAAGRNSVVVTIERPSG